LVNVGSGVSILRVDNPTSYERVSGSSIGGGTFWGLAKMLTDIKDFDVVQKMSEKGLLTKMNQNWLLLMFILLFIISCLIFIV